MSPPAPSAAGLLDAVRDWPLIAGDAAQRLALLRACLAAPNGPGRLARTVTTASMSLDAGRILGEPAHRSAANDDPRDRQLGAQLAAASAAQRLVARFTRTSKASPEQDI
jgi:hypothetical protein